MHCATPHAGQQGDFEEQNRLVCEDSEIHLWTKCLLIQAPWGLERNGLCLSASPGICSRKQASRALKVTVKAGGLGLFIYFQCVCFANCASFLQTIDQSASPSHTQNHRLIDEQKIYG